MLLWGLSANVGWLETPTFTSFGGIPQWCVVFVKERASLVLLMRSRQDLLFPALVQPHGRS